VDIRENAPDRLILVKGRRAELRLTLDGTRWRPCDPKLKSSTVTVADGVADPNVDFWWARSEGKLVRPIKPAIQLIDFSHSGSWSRIFSSDRKVLGAFPGPAVLCVKVQEVPRWFGIVHLIKRVGEADCRIDEITASEILPKGTSYGNKNKYQVLAHDWVCEPLSGGVRLDNADDISNFLKELLHPAVILKVNELADWIPSMKTRLDLDQADGQSFEATLVDLLLEYPSFRARFDSKMALAEMTARQSIEKFEEKREALQKEIEGLRQRKREEVASALDDVIDDNRFLALLAILKLGTPSSDIDLKGLEASLQLIANRPVPKPADLTSLIPAINQLQRPPIDLSPIVSALEKLKSPAPQRPLVVTSKPDPELKYPWLAKRGDVLGSSEQIRELDLSESQASLLIVAHAGRLPIAVGLGAAETVEQLLKVVTAGRNTWWHVPADAASVHCILSDSKVSATILKGRESPSQLFAVVLEGIDRAPTEAYLEPLLVMRRLALPLYDDGKPWPPNLLLFATTAGGGQMILPIAPGCWERSIPISGGPKRQRDVSEINWNLWSATSDRNSKIDITRLLPTGVEAIDPSQLGRSANHLCLEISNELERGLAFASCLARYDGTKPIGEFGTLKRYFK
jgi:hypothetical protein